ncbi:hypothetical protein RRG08_031582 [Elysia crispata]|uniref:Uncharacterized protein n=1 Tax=Elysia crispata TaxID=231223 RepID=A0AAE1E8S6_9GAST|nr:hypothetical protein RRG08_031582 [Elysia crispata]
MGQLFYYQWHETILRLFNAQDNLTYNEVLTISYTVFTESDSTCRFLTYLGRLEERPLVLRETSGQPVLEQTAPSPVVEISSHHLIHPGWLSVCASLRTENRLDKEMYQNVGRCSCCCVTSQGCGEEYIMET